MDLEEFQKKVEQELKKLDRQQVIHFAWRCAVRALPFLGSKGHFDFWNKKDRSRHLYAVFYALDVNAYAADNAYAAAYVAETAARAAAYADAARAVAAAAYAAFADANHIYVSARTEAEAAAAAAADAAAYAAETAARAARAADINKIDLDSIIWQDLDFFYGETETSVSTEVYGQIWDNFQRALAEQGCAYWGNLYQQIFESGFVLDQEALDRRMKVPQEIREQGAVAVANYLEEIEAKGAERLNEARIIILGDKGAGKTCLARKLINPNAKMTTDQESTAGVDTLPWKLRHKKKNQKFNVRIWDFAGHTVTHAVHQFFLSERCLYIVVYNSRTDERNRLEYWLNHMKNYGGDSKAMILVNQRDQHSVDIPINALKEQYAIEGDYTFSNKDDKAKLKSFRQHVARYISNNPSWNQEIPKNYFQVKEELERLFSKGKGTTGKEHITKRQFKKIASKHEVLDPEVLLNDLHALGVSLWYKDMEQFDTLVLNPEWISHGVYKIINWVNEAKKHALTLADFVTVFADDAARYPQAQHQFLFNLMKHYELAYETEQEQCLIIPHLLKEDRPVKLPIFPVGESLMLRYKAEQPLPPHTVSRFIVRHNQEIKKEKTGSLVWRYGVILTDGNGSIALVREEDRIISVSVKGSDKTHYISQLRETLNDIFSSYKSKKPELQYRIERYGLISEEVEEQNPLWLSESKIVNHSQDNVPYYEDSTRQHIDLHSTARIYNISGNATFSESGNISIRNQSTHFNFNHCNIGLQGHLNELAQFLTESGQKEEARELENAANALKQAKQYKTPEEVQATGITNRLQRLLGELNDEQSNLHQAVKGIKHGIGIAQDIGKGYNQLAQWVGLPQVPEPFLNLVKKPKSWTRRKKG